MCATMRLTSNAIAEASMRSDGKQCRVGFGPCGCVAWRVFSIRDLSAGLSEANDAHWRNMFTL